MEIKILHQLFEEQSLRTPTHLAVRCGSKTLTYRELNEKANQFAYTLHTYGDISPEDHVLLLLERDEFIPLCILSIWKAGAAYVPIDPNSPPERIQYYILDSKPKIIITTEKFKNQVKYLFKLNGSYQPMLITIDDLEKASISQHPVGNFQSTVTASNLAYVIYTSGTTGKPKGVMVEHRHVTNTLLAQLDYLNIKSDLTVQKSFALFSSYAFDASVSGIFLPLLSGNTLIIADALNNISMDKFLKEYDIKLLIIASQLLNLIPWDSPLETIILGGETPNLARIKKLHEKGVHLFQEYGLTETTIASTYKELNEQVNMTNIGKPLANVCCYVVDQNGNLTVKGEVGELYIGGSSVARGYLNNPLLTEDRFVLNPFIDRKLKLYKTGDLVKQLENGDLEYLGRNDSQIKVRGFRIELAEIENSLNENASITQSLVLCIKNTLDSSQRYHNTIVAYYTSSQEIESESLRRYLEKRLPKYMIPHVFVPLEKFPVTLHDKIDRDALPIPPFTRHENYIAPYNPIQSTLIELWSNVLELNPQQIGIHDDFFSLGGHSILAIQLVESINNKFSAAISVIDLFKERTVEKIAEKIGPHVRVDSTEDKSASSEEQLSASERMILRDHFSSGALLVYNESFVVEINQKIDHALTISSARTLLEEFPTLNSNYYQQNGRIFRTINPDSNLETQIYDLTLEENSDGTFEKHIHELVKIRFDLEKDKLIRFYLFKLSENKYKLFVTFFHSILDGTSIVNILLPRFAELAGMAKSSAHLRSFNLNKFVEFSTKINEAYNLNQTDKLNYWKETFAVVEPCQLGESAKSSSSHNGSQAIFIISNQTKNILNAHAAQFNISLFDILLGVFFLLLNKFTGQDNIIIKSNIDERLLFPSFSKTLGCFINNLFVNISIESDWTLNDLFKNTTTNKIRGLTNLLSYEMMLDQFRDQVVAFSRIHFNFEPEELSHNTYRHSQLYSHSGEVKNDLYFELDVKSNAIHGRVEYNLQAFDTHFVKRLIACFQNIINNLPSFLDISIKNINVLPSHELSKVLVEFNDTDKEFPQHKTIHQLFEEQVARSPNNIAIIFEDKKLTYKELNVKANQLAHYIKNHYGVEPDDLISLYMERSEYLLVAILAVLKAGAAFVPLDPTLPSERIQFMIEDTQSELILSTKNLINETVLNKTVLTVDDTEVQTQLSDENQQNPMTSLTSRHLAYVIYTSGTTGKPKGVMCEHRGVVNRITWMNDAYPLNENDKILQKTPYGFDVVIWELFWAIWYGACIVFAKPEEHKDANALIDSINHKFITVIHFVPSMLSGFLEALEIYYNEVNHKRNVTLRYLFCSGEALPLPLVKKCHQLLPMTEIHNLYGPTEFSVDALSFPCLDSNLKKIAIGKPIYNTKAYILDNNLIPLPIGARGELFLGGAGIARGYLNREELTSEKFIDNPLFTSPDKLYKTGDQVRWLEDGNIEYLGRNDHQIKIRGYRIECAEIEAALAQHPGIQQSVVTIKTQQDKNSKNNQYLVAYYQAKSEINQNSITNYLINRLPEYMIPNIFVYLAVFPLSINGKINRAALPEPHFKIEENIVLPRNKLETTLYEIWSDVLGLSPEYLSITSDFFKLGGDSITSIRLVNKIRQYLGLKVSVSDILKYRTIERLYDNVIINLKESDVLIASFNQDEEATYLANHLQQGFIYHTLNKDSRDDAYLVQNIFEYKNKLEPGLLKEAWHLAQQKYPTLRLRFNWNDKLLQIVDKSQPINWSYVDISHLDNQSQSAEVEHTINADRAKNYDLAKGSLFRLILLKLADQHYVFVFSHHHIIMDGWSIPVVMDYVHTCYYRLTCGDTISVCEDTAYLNAQHYLQMHLHEQDTYWNNYLAHYNAHLNLTGLLSLKSRHVQLHQYNFIQSPGDRNITIEGDLYDSLLQYGQVHGLTINSILQYVWHRILYIYGGCKQTIVGAVVSNRNLPVENIDKSVGLYINTLPVIVNHEVNTKVSDIIAKLQYDVNQLSDKANVNLATIQKHRQRLFNSIFVYENYPTSQVSYQSGISVKLIKTIEKLDYPLAIIIFNIGINNSMTINCRYAAELFDEARIDDLMISYKKILLEIISKIDHQVFEQHATFNSFNLLNTRYKHYPSNKTIVELFDEQVVKYPNNIALVFNEHKLTYHSLNTLANQLAHYLKENYSIHPDNFIALCLDRCELMIVAILAVLKSGAAYVPMEPSYPDDRIDYIINDAKPQLVITIDKYLSCFKGRIPDHLLLSMDSPLTKNTISNMPTSQVLTALNPDNFAYVIYTSGTTGKPKGVLQLHKNVCRLFSATEEWFNFNSSDVWTLFHSYVFDFSVWEIWGALFYGGKLIIPTYEQTRNFSEFYDLCYQENITVLNQTPTAFYQLSDVAIKHKTNFKLNKLRTIIFGGEALNYSHLNSWLKFYDYHHPQLINMYGITETTVHVTYKPITSDLQETTSNIGWLIPDLTAYVVDEFLNPVPIGAIGELYVGGEGLAKGYLNQEKLTADRFIVNPFQSDYEKNNGLNERLYKTGDLVRCEQDGSLEYIGRNDLQVKIRGYRIELQEIEKMVSDFPGVKYSVVLVKDHKLSQSENKFLVAYYVSEQNLDEEAFFNYLALKLPEYMIPSALVHMENLPLTINGKLDTQLLPEPIFTHNSEYRSPRNDLEKKICDIWSETFNRSDSKVGIRDDFFRLGGDSIISIQLIGRLNQHLGIKLSIKDIFSYKTIERLYDNVISKLSIDRSIRVQSESGILEGPVALLPIQEWFFSQKYSNVHYWNQAFFILVPELDIARLRSSVSKLLSYHDAFRLRYSLKNEITQFYDASIIDIQFRELNVSGLLEQQIKEVLTKWQSNFNITNGPVYCVGYLHGYPDKHAKIFFAFHHLIVDAVSWRILTEDLKCIYQEQHLPEKKSSYRQWSNLLSNYKNLYSDEEIFWNEMLADFKPVLMNAFVEDENNTTSIELSLSEVDTQKLLHECNNSYSTEINDILLTALGLTLAEFLQNNVNHIILEGHGREELDESLEITHTMGWFTTLFPIRLNVCDDVVKSLISIKETLRQIPRKGIGYGAIIGYKNNLLPRISFNYLGRFESSIQVPWSISTDSTGLTVDPNNNDYYVINMNGLVINNKLQFTIHSKMSLERLNHFSQLYSHYLKALIVQLSQAKRSYLTQSDVSNTIEPDYLDQIQSSHEIEYVFPANSLQQGFITHALNQGKLDEAYRVQIVWVYHNVVNVDRLQKAWQFAQQKFPSLRLRFAWEKELIQIVNKVEKLDWRFVDLSHFNSLNSQEESINKILYADRSEPYDLERGNLFRVTLIKQHDQHYTCIFNNHHAIMDGWSVPVLFNEIHKIYLQLCKNESVTIVQDHAYVNLQSYLKAAESDYGYWREYLQNSVEKPNLTMLLQGQPSFRISDSKQFESQKYEVIVIEQIIYHKLKNICKSHAVTFTAILQYGWHKFLNVFGNSKQTIVGTIVSGRNYPVDNIEKSVGLFINTVPIIVTHDTEKSLIELVQLIQSDINEANSRSNVSLSSLQINGERLFDTLFIYENFPSAQVNLKGLIIDVLPNSTKLDYPLALICKEEQESTIKLELRYAAELFDQDLIHRILNFMVTILQQFADDPQKPSKQLRLINECEYTNIIINGNDTRASFPDSKTLTQLFEHQVTLTPNAIAIVYEDKTYTYNDLNQLANQMASYLKTNYQLYPDDIVALYLDRNESMIIAILAVLKVGAVYVPIDLSFPLARINYILKDSQAKLLLLNGKYLQKIQMFDLPPSHCVAIDTLSDEITKEPVQNPVTLAESSNLCYVIYTSGTTGTPKGVMIEHQAIVNRLNYLREKHTITPDYKIAAKTSYVFDPSIREIFLALTSGARLILISESVYKDAHALFNVCLKENINLILFVPSHLTVFLDALTAVPKHFIEKLDFKLIYCCGEVLTPKLAENVFKYFPQVKIKNQYGPTEACQFSYEYEITANTFYHQHNLPVGYLVDNMKGYVLDEHLNPVPLGTVGDLYIGGIGLRGYLNQPNITNEKFIANPFQTALENNSNTYKYLYKTGDLVRLNTMGALEFIGRNDFQVKIRGFRVELSEIERVLSKFPEIKQCIVVEKNQYLIAYYLSSKQIVEPKLNNYLRTTLPDYMIPHAFVHLAELPLTINGKVNRNALPQPEISHLSEYVTPKNEQEEKVRSLFADILSLPETKIGIHDDFFHLGGNSLLAIKLSNRLKSHLNADISVASIFKLRTIQKISDAHATKIQSSVGVEIEF